MHFRNFILFVLVLLNADLAKSSEFVVFTRANNSTNSIQIPAGEAWKLVNWYGEIHYENGAPFFQSNSYWLYGTGFNGPNTILFSPSSLYGIDAWNYFAVVGALMTGPSTIQAGPSTLSGSANYYLVFEKLGTSENSSDAVSPTSVVIPAAASGDVDIKLEQSADTLTWTECLPGTYNSSTVKRFFRLRAVEK